MGYMCGSARSWGPRAIPIRVTDTTQVSQPSNRSPIRLTTGGAAPQYLSRPTHTPGAVLPVRVTLEEIGGGLKLAGVAARSDFALPSAKTAGALQRALVGQ